MIFGYSLRSLSAELQIRGCLVKIPEVSYQVRSRTASVVSNLCLGPRMDPAPLHSLFEGGRFYAHCITCVRYEETMQVYPCVGISASDDVIVG